MSLTDTWWTSQTGCMASTITSVNIWRWPVTGWWPATTARPTLQNSRTGTKSGCTVRQGSAKLTVQAVDSHTGSQVTSSGTVVDTREVIVRLQGRQKGPEGKLISDKHLQFQCSRQNKDNWLLLLFMDLEARQLLRLFAPIYNWKEIKSWSVYITSKQNV
jgi:hypothetical protein